MKNFFKIVFATFLSLVLFAVVIVLLGIGTLVGLARLGAKQEPKIEKGSFLVVDMSVNITDAPPPSDSSLMLGRALGRDETDTVSLRSLLQAIHAASRDNRIGGIFLHGSLSPVGYGSGFAALKEAREALMDFRKSNKPVIAYLVDPNTRDYYLASAADTIYLNPFGEMDIPGLATQPMFLKGALDKYGIGVQVVRHGKYKSAVEPFLLDKMSPESREQTQKLLDDVWAQFKAGVEESRGIPADKLQALVDAKGIITPADAKAAGLINDTAYLPDVIDQLRQKAGADNDDRRHTFRQVDLTAYIKDKVGKVEAADSSLAAAGLGGGAPRLAVVYAEGEIVDGEGEATNSVGGDRYARVLRRLRQDPSVKGIVLRVNSPGGSGLASEVIQHELALARGAGKTVVVSMGTVAASGGYWISTAADRVFAEPNTITGSIGVFGILPNIQGLANNNGVTFDEVKTGKFAGLQTASRPKTPEEFNAVQTLVEDFYKRFVDKVADARKMPADKVDEIAQGRVWSGGEALKLGLVDEIGGLDNALAFAKTKAGLATDAKIVEFPAPRELAEQVAELFSGDRRPTAGSDARLLRSLGVGPKAGPVGRALGDMQTDLGTLSRLNDPMGTYARLPFDLRMN